MIVSQSLVPLDQTLMMPDKPLVLGFDSQSINVGLLGVLVHQSCVSPRLLSELLRCGLVVPQLGKLALHVPPIGSDSPEH